MSNDIQFDSRTPPALVTIIVSMLSLVIGLKLVGFDLERILDAYSQVIVSEIQNQEVHKCDHTDLEGRLQALEEVKAQHNVRLEMLEVVAHEAN